MNQVATTGVPDAAAVPEPSYGRSAVGYARARHSSGRWRRCHASSRSRAVGSSGAAWATAAAAYAAAWRAWPPMWATTPACPAARAAARAAGFSASRAAAWAPRARSRAAPMRISPRTHARAPSLAARSRVVGVARLEEGQDPFRAGAGPRRQDPSLVLAHGQRAECAAHTFKRVSEPGSAWNVLCWPNRPAASVHAARATDPDGADRTPAPGRPPRTLERTDWSASAASTATAATN